MQIVADVLQQKLHRLHGHPGSCLGAAWAAAMGAGLANDWGGVAGFTEYGDDVLPDPSNALTYQIGYRKFRDLYKRQE
jgi:xylulokinase